MVHEEIDSGTIELSWTHYGKFYFHPHKEIG